MKLPPGYGQIVKLSGKRRRPFAVRIDAGTEEKTPGHFVRKQKYLGYFEKRTEALDFLTKYNAGIDVVSAPSVASLPTFSDVYDGFIDWYDKKHPEAAERTRAGYITAYHNTESLHCKKFVSIRASDLQDVIAQYSNKSRGTSSQLIKLFHGMYKYAIMNEIVDKDYSQFVFNEGKKSDPIHKPFAPEEIKALWNAEIYPVLIMIYTGMRIGEYLKIECENIHFDERYMIGGIKTAAGKNRVIPIHESIAPLIRDRLNHRFLFGDDERDSYFSFSQKWNKWMSRINADHLPHDTRHTCATLMEQSGVPLHHQKLILGHAVRDITQGIYTHVEMSVLVEDINRLPDYKYV